MPDQSSAATEHAIIQEITRPLERLPDDPLEIVNAEFPTVLRGYDRVAVDDYVRQTRQLVAELQATRSPEAAVRRALERVGEQIAGILQRAHETAESITAQSRSEAEDRLEQARQEANQVIAAAEQRVRDLDSDTDRIWLERQRIVADAEDLAAQLHAVARSAAERFPEDVEAEPDAPEDDEAEPNAPEDDDAGARIIGPDAELAEPEWVRPPEAEESDDPVVPFDGETTAETVEHPMSSVDSDEDADFFGDSGDSPDERSEVERTMPFRPLTPGTGPGSGDDPAQSPGLAEEGAEPTAESDPPRATDDGGDVGAVRDPDATQIIPPSSQAASRRHEQ